MFPGSVCNISDYKKEKKTGGNSLCCYRSTKCRLNSLDQFVIHFSPAVTFLHDYVNRNTCVKCVVFIVVFCMKQVWEIPIKACRLYNLFLGLPMQWTSLSVNINLLKPICYLMHQQFNIQQLYVLPTLYLCVLYLSENKQRLVPLTA